MRLYRAKIPQIAHDCIDTLVREGDVEIEPANLPESELDLVAIMEEYIRRDFAFREGVKDRMERRGIPYNEYSRTRQRMADEMTHPVGEDVERFLCRQFVENMMISRFVEEVFEEDEAIYKKLIAVLRSHDVDEQEIRDEAESKIKNVRPGTMDWEIALQHAVREVKKRRGLL
jgi:hypothetical protein